MGQKLSKILFAALIEIDHIIKWRGLDANKAFKSIHFFSFDARLASGFFKAQADTATRRVCRNLASKSRFAATCTPETGKQKHRKLAQARPFGQVQR